MKSNHKKPLPEKVATGKASPDIAAKPKPKDNLPLSGRMAYKINEAAQLIGVSDNSIRRLIERGQLKAIGSLRHILIPHSAIEEFLGINQVA
jgi:excisionase family DNA binding protein